MRRITVLLLVAIALACRTGAFAAGKVTADPNADARPAPVADKADARLLQKVTCSSGYARLHGVTEEIEKMTGVAVRAGANNPDWQVRDIPVTVCAKDVPLGKLLRAVADATHTQFTVTKSEDKEPKYRIFRDRKTADDIDARFKARREARFAEAYWAWDSLAKFGAWLESQSEADTKNLGVPEETMLMARILSHLDDGAKAQAFSGEHVFVEPATFAQPDLLKEMYRKGWNKTGASKNGQLLGDEAASCSMCLSVQDGGDTGLTIACSEFYYRFRDPRMEQAGVTGDGGISWLGVLSDEAPKLKEAKGFDLPKRPEAKDFPEPAEEYPNSRYRPLKTPEDWQMEVLKAKITLKAREGEAHATLADALTAISKASGFAIVCEDFDTHRISGEQYDRADGSGYDKRLDGFFVGETTLGDALKRLKPYNMFWLIDEEDKLIVGWAEKWRERHRNLMPEAIIANLRKKMNGEGAQLDDVTPLVNFGYEQVDEWVKHSPDIKAAAWGNRYMDDLSGWMLYESLTPEDKALAKSREGLPLGKLDPDRLCGFFRQRKRETIMLSYDEKRKQEIRDREQLKDETLCDPAVVSRLALRLSLTPILKLDNGKPPRETGGIANLYVEGEIDGKPLRVQFEGPRETFPLYSPKRLKELAEKTK